MEFTLVVKDGQPTGVFCLGYDITEYEKAKTNFTIVNQDLKQKRIILDSIAFDQAHLVRAPLANIIGITEILKKMDVDTNVSNLLDMLAQSTEQLDNVVKTIVNKTNQKP